MYEKITTDGVVLRKRAAGEANARVSVLTRELGLVAATARSARKEASKLRFGLEPLTLAQFCFVRGTHEWRIAEVQNIRFLKSSVRAGRIVKLLLRLVQGQEGAPKLFDAVAEGLHAFVHAKEEHAEAIECVLVLRILSHLGYLPHSEALAPFVEGRFSIELSAKALESRALLVKTINDSLHATGL